MAKEEKKEEKKEKPDDKAKKAPPTPEEEAKKAKKKKLLILILAGVLVVAGGAAAAFMFLAGGKKHAPEDSGEHKTAESHEGDAEGGDGKAEGHGKKEEAKGGEHGPVKKEDLAKKEEGHGKKEEAKGGEHGGKKEEAKGGEHGGGGKKDDKKEEVKYEGDFGAVFALQPFHLNLGNPLENRYIRLEVALEYKGGPGQEAELKTKVPQLRDAIVTVVSRKTREHLLSPDGKDQLRHELRAKINGYLEKKIDSVFITDLLIE